MTGNARDKIAAGLREAIAVVRGEGVPLTELRPNECKFPVNNPAPGEEHLFCGAPAAALGKPWCAFHAALVRSAP